MSCKFAPDCVFSSSSLSCSALSAFSIIMNQVARTSIESVVLFSSFLRRRVSAAVATFRVCKHRRHWVGSAASRGRISYLVRHRVKLYTEFYGHACFYLWLFIIIIITIIIRAHTNR